MEASILFYLLSALSVISALFVVFSRSPIYSVLSLIVCFFTIAGHYIMLNAQFLAIIHIIVYAGAIMVLMLFTVMLLNLNEDVSVHKFNITKLIAVITGGLLFLVILASVKSSSLLTYQAPANLNIGNAQDIGMKLFTDYLLPFEISSVLFVSAMISAVLLAKKEVK